MNNVTGLGARVFSYREKVNALLRQQNRIMYLPSSSDPPPDQGKYGNEDSDADGIVPVIKISSAQ
jgi:hypothetical protein